MQWEDPDATDTALARREHELMQLAERRVRIIVHAMTAFYLAVGSFALGTMLALVGAALVAPQHELARLWELRLTVAACVVGVLAIMMGSLALVFESRITFRILTEEADLLRHRHARKPVA